MKKSIVILIGVVYIMSIIVIGFFGMKITSYNTTVYPDEIEILSVECEDEERVSIKEANLNIPGTGVCKYIITYDFQEGKDNVFSLVYRVYPDTTSDKGVNFGYDKQTAPISEIDEKNNFWIKNRGGAVVKISAVSRPTVQVMFYLSII